MRLNGLVALANYYVDSLELGLMGALGPRVCDKALRSADPRKVSKSHQAGAISAQRLGELLP
jgi:hypothetical protein